MRCCVKAFLVSVSPMPVSRNPAHGRRVSSRVGTSYRWLMVVPSLKLTFSHLKMDGWNASFLLGWPIFQVITTLVSGSATNL